MKERVAKKLRRFWTDYSVQGAIFILKGGKGEMKRAILVILAITSSVLLISASQKSCGPNGTSAPAKKKDLGEAVQSLSDPDKTVRRAAARDISAMVSEPGIETAIQPLSDTLLNKKTISGIFTQEICAENLGRIAAQKGPLAEKAIDALMESARTDKFDVVRAASVHALGASMSEKAVQPIQEAYAKDSSLLVRYAAQDALDRLARSGIFKPSQASTADTSGMTKQSKVTNEQVYEYLRSRVIYANPPLKPARGGK